MEHSIHRSQKRVNLVVCLLIPLKHRIWSKVCLHLGDWIPISPVGHTAIAHANQAGKLFLTKLFGLSKLSNFRPYFILHIVSLPNASIKHSIQNVKNNIQKFLNAALTLQIICVNIRVNPEILELKGEEKMRVHEMVRAYIDDHHLKQISVAKAANIPNVTFNAMLNAETNHVC